MFQNIKIHKIFVTGLQETRSKKSGIFKAHGLIRVISQCPDGTYGCELIINPDCVVGSHSKSGKHAKVGKDDVSIVHEEHRLLIARCSAKGLFAIAVGLGRFAFAATRS